MERQVLYFEDVKVGDVVTPLVKPITAVGMVMYAASTWDFHRYHFDLEYANSMGVEKPFLDGQELGAFLAQQVVDWAGVEATLKRLSFRYANFVFAGDTLTCTGHVSSKFQEEGKGLVECELWIENQRGQRVLEQGRAIVALPLRGSVSQGQVRGGAKGPAARG